MEHALSKQARSLFQAALLVFVVTIVIGILNGLDIWDPPRTLVLTHVHAGTLGWITLGVIGVSLLVFGSDGDQTSAGNVARASIAATVLYVIAFATTTGVFRPIAGTLMLIAIVYAFSWVTARRGRAERTVASLGLYLALISLVIGAILGVLLGLFIANGSLPGLSAESAGNLAGAHPPAMLAGYLILAGAAISEWLLSGQPALAKDSRSGVLVVWALFVAGILFNVAIIFGIEPLIQLASLLQVIAVVVFVVRMWGALKPEAWRAGGYATYPRWAVVYLVIGVAILVYIVQLFVSGQLDPESGEGAHIVIAFDHAFFIGLMTNALLAASAIGLAWTQMEKVIAWLVNLGLLGFLVGLMVESAPIKRISTPIMGAALLAAIYARLMPREVSTSTA